MTVNLNSGTSPSETAEPSAGLSLPTTRFSRLLVPDNFLDRLQVVDDTTTTTIQQVLQDFEVRRLGYHGDVKRDPQYKISVDFSDDDGLSFTDQMLSATGNRIYQIRTQIAQLQATPLLTGFGLTWFLPAGWAFTDGLIAGPLYEEAVSNPLTVTRTILSPSNPQPAAFRVEMVERFR